MARVAIIGCGPAGLMAAEVLAQAGHTVVCFEAMPTVGRKLLMAGKSGLNLTHSEPLPDFIRRYGDASDFLAPMLHAFSPRAVCEWAAALGVPTYTGSSGRVFPVVMKASPLLRAWVSRLQGLGVTFQLRHRWLGWAPESTGSTPENLLIMERPEGLAVYPADACLLAMGGASWARLGSDGRWADTLAQQGIELTPFRPANCGFVVNWREHFWQQFAGVPVKAVAARQPGGALRQGEFVITRYGVEGSLIYGLAAWLRDGLEQGQPMQLELDLLPGQTLEKIQHRLAHPRGKISFSNYLRRQLGLTGVKAALLRECVPALLNLPPEALARFIKACPLALQAPRPLDEAISTAGGVALTAVNEGLMLRQRPGVFCAGEMLDWEAPTGGYLLTACMATGRWAGQAMADWLRAKEV